MTIISKPVDRLVPSAERTQVFTQADLSTGDIIDIFTTLGKNAKQVRVETLGGSDLAIRRNVVHTIFPDRTGDDRWATPLNEPYKNLALGVQKIDDTIGYEIVGTDVTLLGLTKDLQVTWSSGTWIIVVE